MVDFVLNYATARPGQRIDRSVPLAHPPKPETWKTWGNRTIRSWFWDRTTTAGQLLTRVADLLLAVLLARIFSGLCTKAIGETDTSRKTATSDKFQTDKANADTIDFDFGKSFSF